VSVVGQVTATAVTGGGGTASSLLTAGWLLTAQCLLWSLTSASSYRMEMHPVYHPVVVGLTIAVLPSLSPALTRPSRPHQLPVTNIFPLSALHPSEKQRLRTRAPDFCKYLNSAVYGVDSCGYRCHICEMIYMICSSRWYDVYRHDGKKWCIGLLWLQSAAMRLWSSKIKLGVTSYSK